MFRMKICLEGLKKVTSPDVIESVKALTQSNRRVTVDEIARTLSISVGTGHKIAHDDPGYSKVSCRWMPYKLHAYSRAQTEEVRVVPAVSLPL